MRLIILLYYFLHFLELIAHYFTGDWVAGEYEGKIYAGKIVRMIDKTHYKINAMEPTTTGQALTWTNSCDIHVYLMVDIKPKNRANNSLGA